MPYHEWNDKWFNRFGSDLSAAMDFIYNRVKRYTRCTLIFKEKYGFVRYEYVVPPYGHVCMLKFVIRAPWTKHTKYGSFKPILWSWNESWIYRKWQHFGWVILRQSVYAAIKRYPYLAAELMSDLASNERLVGQRIHEAYWTKFVPGEESDELGPEEEQDPSWNGN